MGVKEGLSLPETTGMVGLLAAYLAIFVVFGVGIYLLYVGLTATQPGCTSDIDQLRVVLGAIYVGGGIGVAKILLNSLEKG